MVFKGIIISQNFRYVRCPRYSIWIVFEILGGYQPWCTHVYTTDCDKSDLHNETSISYVSYVVRATSLFQVNISVASNPGIESERTPMRMAPSLPSNSPSQDEK